MGDDANLRPDQRDSRRRALGELIRRARGATGDTIDQAAARAPMSPETWRKAEAGARVKPFSLAAIERVLGWAPGAAGRFLDSGEQPATTAVDVGLVLRLDRPDVVKVGLIEAIKAGIDPIDAILAMDLSATDKVNLIAAYREAQALAAAEWGAQRPAHRSAG